MNTLILLGSPKEGESFAMAKALAAALPGEVRFLWAYRLHIAPCRDCGFCRSRFGCPIKDDAQSLWQSLEWADHIVVASPVYFYSVPGPLKTAFDRCQPYWAARILRKEKPTPKSGAALLTGGAPSHENQFAGALQAIGGWFREVGVSSFEKVLLPGTDKIGFAQSLQTQQQIVQLAKLLSRQQEG